MLNRTVWLRRLCAEPKMYCAPKHRRTVREAGIGSCRLQFLGPSHDPPYPWAHWPTSHKPAPILALHLATVWPSCWPSFKSWAPWLPNLDFAEDGQTVEVGHQDGQLAILSSSRIHKSFSQFGHDSQLCARYLSMLLRCDIDPNHHQE